MAASAYYAQVQQLYVAYFGRPADKLGLEYYAKLLDANGGNDKAMLHDFANSAESKALYNQTSLSAKVASMYVTLFGREGDIAGITYWASEVQAGKVLLSEVAAAIAFNAQAADKAAFSAKLAAADAFTAKIDTTAELVAYETNPSVGRTWLSSVKDTATQTSAAATIDATLTAAVNGTNTTAGQTFTLTKSVQVTEGTLNNDTFIAGDEGGSATLNAGDTIHGNSGKDTLKLFNATNALNAANFANAVVTGVEGVEATLSASGQTLDVSGNADVVTVGLTNGTDGVVTLNLKQQAGLTGTITTAAAATFTYKNATGTADAATLNVANANTAGNTTATNGVGVNIANIETLNIVAAGTNTLGTLASGAEKLVITGEGSVAATLTNAAGGASAVKTIDASAATGKITIDNKSAGAQIESIKTGSADDIYTTQYANLTKDDVIELAAGTDALRFSDSATFNSTATAERLTKVTGVDVLGVVGTGVTLTVDGDFVSQNGFYAAGTNAAVALTNVKNNADLTFGAGAEAASTVGMKLGANTLNVNLAGSATAAANLSAGLTVTGSATVNVKSTGTDGVAANALSLTAADNQSVIVTGAKDLTLTVANAPSTTGFSVDASAFTGKLNVTGTNDADIIKGGSGDDVINGGFGSAGTVGVTAVKETFEFKLNAVDNNSKTIVFDGVTTTLAVGDDTAAEAATAIAAKTFTNWDVAVKVGATDTVVFTQKTGAAYTDATVASFTGTWTSTGATVTKTQDGVTGVTAVAVSGFAADQMTGGAGKDKFIVSTANSLVPVAADADIVTDFVSGTDTLSFLSTVAGGANVAATATNYGEGTAAVASFAAALSAANTQITTGVGAVLFSAQQVGTDTYVFFDGSGDGDITSAAGDYIVKLTGVTLEGIAYTDIVA